VGREAIEGAEINDDLEYPTGLERWLVQLWARQDGAEAEG
jgi:hypothetical protein